MRYGGELMLVITVILWWRVCHIFWYRWHLTKPD